MDLREMIAELVADSAKLLGSGLALGFPVGKLAAQRFGLAAERFEFCPRAGDRLGFLSAFGVPAVALLPDVLAKKCQVAARFLLTLNVVREGFLAARHFRHVLVALGKALVRGQPVALNLYARCLKRLAER